MNSPDSSTPVSRRAALGRTLAIFAAALIRPTPLHAKNPSPFEHPEPRPGVTAEHVLPLEKLPPKRKRVVAAYGYARAYPSMFDGIYCTCDCRDSMHHRSLLSCYESDQPTGCGACLEVAALVGELAEKGQSLAEIRKAVDRKFD
jgi:hypothetical protein